MEPVPPFWFKQRQCKIEPAGPNMVKVTGPNLREAFLRIEPVGSTWKAALRLTATGDDVQATATEFTTAPQAWDAAFEPLSRPAGRMKGSVVGSAAANRRSPVVRNRTTRVEYNHQQQPQTEKGAAHDSNRY